MCASVCFHYDYGLASTTVSCRMSNCVTFLPVSALFVLVLHNRQQQFPLFRSQTLSRRVSEGVRAECSLCILAAHLHAVYFLASCRSLSVVYANSGWRQSQCFLLGRYANGPVRQMRHAHCLINGVRPDREPPSLEAARPAVLTLAYYSLHFTIHYFFAYFPLVRGKICA